MAKKKIGSQMRPIQNTPYGVISFSLTVEGASYIVDAQVLRIRDSATEEVISEEAFEAFAELHPAFKKPGSLAPKADSK